MIEVTYLNSEGYDEQWPNTRGNHTDKSAIERVNNLPECIREHMWTNDPCWSYCPEGWRDLVTRLHNALVQVAPDYRLSQIKEKFGGLRFYTNISHTEDSIPHMIISHFESMSTTTCDVCGKRGMVVQAGPDNWPYVASRCEEHYEEKRARSRA